MTTSIFTNMLQTIATYLLKVLFTRKKNTATDEEKDKAKEAGSGKGNKSFD
jgi:hypothetical protein